MPPMTYSRAVVVALGLALVALGACASSRPEGTGIDAAGDTTDAAGTDDDASDTTDAAAIDASSIDGPNIDAVPNDGTLPIDAPTDANSCPTAPCDLYAQCGCTSPLVCDLDFTDLVGNSCRAVNMAGTETSTCFSGNPAAAQPSYCAGGYVCLGSGTQAACERYCDASSDCGQPRGQCVIQVTNGSTPIPNVQVCSSNCNPVNSAAGPCPAGQGKCGFFTVTNSLTGGVARDVVQCTAPGAGAHGAACTTDTTCAADTLCTTVNALSRCRRVCNRTTGGNECASLGGTTCIGFTTPLTVGGTEYGVCAP
jgi:hypothetical protein